MKYPIEEHMPYFALALVVLVLFYTVYFVKMLIQHKHGIKTRQIGRRKEKDIHTLSNTTTAPCSVLTTCDSVWYVCLFDFKMLAAYQL